MQILKHRRGTIYLTEMGVFIARRITTGNQGYIEPEQAVMQQVKAWLEQAVKGCNIRLTDEPVLFKTGLSASTLPHMEHDVATTPGQRKVWQEKMREREANLKARGLLS